MATMEEYQAYFEEVRKGLNMDKLSFNIESFAVQCKDEGMPAWECVQTLQLTWQTDKMSRRNNA